MSTFWTLFERPKGPYTAPHFSKNFHRVFVRVPDPCLCTKCFISFVADRLGELVHREMIYKEQNRIVGPNYMND